jgi:hypothetical protein
MSEKSIAYFKKAVMKYSKGNVEELFDKQIECAGTYLDVVCNGIDLMGGICYGFHEGVGTRSKRFMKEHMNIEETIADLLYTCVRCGITHQGMPKIGIRYGLRPERTKPEIILYKNEDNDVLYLNVTELVLSYLTAIERIAQNPAAYALHIPPFEPKVRTSFINALNYVPNEISELCEAVEASHGEEEEARFSRGEIDTLPSSSAYFPDNVLNISLDI